VQTDPPETMTDRKPPVRPGLQAPSDAQPPRSQRDLVAASLLRAPVPRLRWDERTRLEYRGPSR
jgi:hypothetical protein